MRIDSGGLRVLAARPSHCSCEIQHQGRAETVPGVYGQELAAQAPAYLTAIRCGVRWPRAP